MKQKLVCALCGSENVARDAWAEWDVEAQTWVVRSVFDAGYCFDEDNLCSTKFVPVEDLLKDSSL